MADKCRNVVHPKKIIKAERDGQDDDNPNKSEMDREVDVVFEEDIVHNDAEDEPGEEQQRDPEPEYLKLFEILVEQ